MKRHIIFLFGLGLIVTACAEKERAESEPAAKAAAPATEAAQPSEPDESWRNAGFLKHMHRHAEKLDELNFALAEGDLEAARMPAYWLAKHETYRDIQSEWLPYLYAMRTEAEAVETATDLETASAAALRITVQCQGCHASAGVSTD